MTELERLLEKIPEPMRSDLREQDPVFAAEIARDYLAASPESQADMLAFFESDGPRRVGEAKQREEDGTPTSGDLERWMEGDAT